MNFEYQNKGLSGLANLGNTCFMNSCMQILSHTYELNNFLNLETLKKNKKNKKNNEKNNILNSTENKYDLILLNEWNNLRLLLWNENCIISPDKFLKTVQKIAQIKDNDLFSGFSQNDVPEFLLFIINCFHNATSRNINITITGEIENNTDKIAVECYKMVQNMYSKEYSEIWSIFYAIHISEIISLETNNVLQINPEPFFILDLPIPPNNKLPSLIDCLNFYVQGEILEGENAWFNENTKKKENVQKKISVWSLPTILVIDFKRFNSKNQKNQILITFPLDNLNLSNYIIGYNKNSYIYELYGIANHSGSSYGGHYTAYIKNANNKWYHFNDTSVSEVKLTNSIISSKAYVLFYRKSIPL